MSCVEGLVPNVMLLGDGRTFKVSPTEKALCHWGIALQQLVGSQQCPHCLLRSKYEVIVLLHHRTKNNRANQLWAGASNTVSQNQSFLLL
jgi:hypothetical protein